MWLENLCSQSKDKWKGRHFYRSWLELLKREMWVKKSWTSFLVQHRQLTQARKHWSLTLQTGEKGDSGGGAWACSEDVRNSSCWKAVKQLAKDHRKNLMSLVVLKHLAFYTNWQESSLNSNSCDWHKKWQCPPNPICLFFNQVFSDGNHTEVFLVTVCVITCCSNSNWNRKKLCFLNTWGYLSVI